MIPLSTVAILEKNKLSSDGAWLVLLEVQLTTGVTLRSVRNNEDIIWNSQTWVAFPFQLDEIGESSKGELPQAAVRISNVTRSVQQYIEAGNGGVGSTVIVRVVHSKHLNLTNPEIELSFAVTGTTSDANWVTFTLGMEYPSMLRYPQKRVLKDWCHYKEYKGIECGATSALPTCNRTLKECRERGNSTRFGGFPAIPGGGIYA